MAKMAPFHLQQNTDVNVVEQTVRLGSRGDIDVWELADRTLKTEDDYRKRIFAFLRQLGVLSGLSLAPFGKRLADLQTERPELMGEALHLCLATLHTTRQGTNFSWAYQAICDYLWARGDCVFREETRSELVGIIIHQAAQTFDVDAGTIAFSKTSMNGASHWLAATHPPALDEVTNQFKRRLSVSAFSILWAIDALYRAENGVWGTRLSLSEANTTRLCQWLLLEPDALPAVLSLAERTEGGRKTATGSKWLTVGAEGGYGRWVLLAAPCPVGAMEPGVPSDTEDADAQTLPSDENPEETEEIE